ncbi:hypothetical protein HHI36_021085 [Cryptolaemus montrouzieri]|uniref:BPL/LPL catalytic domain-containing protein n=1 Tax=Cryptolaemus montrouzieri TaxID=559131 RepID=A0ABD2MWL0_9CUCU
MIFTIYYMYATVLQWWRLGSLRNKLNGTLNTKNALLLSSSKTIHNSKRQRSIENLLFHVEERIACTIVPKQNVNLSHWIIFPKDPSTFPIFFQFGQFIPKPPHVYLIVRTLLDNYNKHEGALIQIENFGELVAWKATSKFEILLKTDVEHLTKLVHCFWNSPIDINHDLEMLELETVNVDGNANKIKYDRKYSLGERLKYSHSPVHWKKFSGEVKDLYLRIRENSNPKIKIENGASKTEDHKVPIYEAKPIKKEARKQTEDKNTLEVGGSDYRRHKSGDKRDKPVEDKHKTERKAKEELSKIKELKTEPPTKTKTKNLLDKSELTNRISVSNPDSSSDRIKVEAAGKAKTEVEVTSTLKDKDKSGDKVFKTKEVKKGRSKDAVEQKLKRKDLKESSKECKSVENCLPEETDSKSSEKSKITKLKELKQRKSISKESDTENVTKQNGKGVTAKADTDAVKTDSSSNENKISGSKDHKLKLKASTKPLNILVYADTVTAKENVKIVLNSVINSEKYIVYDLPSNASTTPVWSDYTALVVICGATTPELTSQLLHYLVNGGQLLCLCSDLLHSILNVFSTAEVREHELVRFSYGEWKRVKMMHHIFCYQASPARKQFSKDSVESNHSNGSSPIAPRTPSSAEIQHNGKNYILQVQVLGTEETWQTPSLLLANVKNSKGRAVFSQVHLEIDPLQYEEDENKFIALKDSNQARLEIFTDILKNRLDIDCTRNCGPINYTPAYFLGRHDMKMQMFNDCKDIVDNTLNCGEISLVFCGKNVDPGIATASRLPVMLYSCPSSFSTVDYFSTLDTEVIGRLVIYTDVITSSQHILRKSISHGLVAIPRQQSAGIGRSNNTWLSPIGSACFSLQLHIPLSSPLGRMLSLVQQLVIVAVVEALKKNSGYENLNIGIKWPNDIYIDKAVKIGGLIVSSTMGNKMAVLNIGCGFNLSNPEPTTSLNDYIERYNEENQTNLKKLSHEKYFARVFNEIESLYDVVQNDNVDVFYDLYYKHWIHKDAKIRIKTEDGSSQNATVVGIDDFGFLKVKLENGEVSVVHPDGNTFDMIQGLIAPKPSFKK